MKKFNYNTKDYDFNTVLSNFLGVDKLEHIHKTESFGYNNVFERKNDQSTHWHKKYYEKENPFFDVYGKFLENEILSLYNEPIVCQVIPNIRFHFPSNIAVGEWHRDKQYRDIEWCDHVKELNYYLPLVDVYGTNTIWAESEPEKEDFSPMECNYGQFFQWDASNLLHGNKLNTTHITRVSVDFRVISKSRFKKLEKGSINTNTVFDIGGYYMLVGE